jgi:NAD(P)-dependent dehydrogenase (short-subunit alcohol dehydrogenase family)
MSSWLTIGLQKGKEGAAELGSCIAYNTGLRRRSRPPVDITGNGLKGKTAIVTGSNRGIGKEVVENLASRGCRVIMAVRDVKSGQDAVNQIQEKHPSSTIDVMPLDLSSWVSVRDFANGINGLQIDIDFLINNAAICLSSKQVVDPQLVDGNEGLETMIVVNYYSTVLLSLLLYDKIKMTSGSKIIFVSSLAHLCVHKIYLDDMNWPKGLPYFDSYGHTKLALMCFIKKFAQRAHRDGVRVYGVDPGVSKSDLGRDMKWYHYYAYYSPISRIYTRSVKESADSILCSLLADDKSKYDPLCFYFSDGKPRGMSKAINNEKDLESLWEQTKNLLKTQFQM